MAYKQTGLTLIKKAFNRETVERIPWVPFAGVHAAKLTGIGAEEYLKSSEHIFNGVSKAVELYKPDGIPVVFDLQIEAEALGCRLNWPDNSPPSVISHPLQEGVKIDDLSIPLASEGRIPVIMDAAKQLREKYPDIALYGLITGPFTLSLHLLGTDIFMKMFEDPEEVNKVMSFCADVGKMMTDSYIRAGCDVIAMVDPMTSQIDPASFETFVSPRASDIFSNIRKKESLSSFFVCGNARQNIEAMCRCRPDNISIDENIPLDYVRDTALANDISFGGNMRLTTVLLMGTPEECQREALECMDTGGRKGFVLAPGCDLPMDTPIENLRAVTDVVHDEMRQGELRASTATVLEVEKLDLSSHWSKEKVMIDIITLDSSSCAPCQYMVDAVARASHPFGEKVVYKEHKITGREGVQMMASLGVKNLPTIVIDGNIEFISQIPPVGKLEEKIGEYLKSKKG
ncbi:MAG: uroporphyrinogen decarboxylase family protein [Bacteroidales bacterium]